VSRGIIQTAASRPTLGLELDYRPAFKLRADDLLIEEPIRSELALQDTGHRASNWLTYFSEGDLKPL
jgi:hypothetical protein